MSVPRQRTPVTVAVVAAVGAALVGLVDAVRPLPAAWGYVRAGLGAVAVVVLVALLVRRLAQRRGRDAPTSSSPRRRRAR